jgi:hypothetical protein
MLSDRTEDVQHHSAGGRLGVEVHAENAKAGPLLFDAIHDFQEVPHRAGKPIELSGHKDIALTEVVDRSIELLALSDAAYLLGEDLFAAGGQLFGTPRAHVGLCVSLATTSCSGE